MAPFIRFLSSSQASSSSMDNQIVPLDCTDNTGSIDNQAESSYKGEIHIVQTELRENGNSRERSGDNLEIDGMIVKLLGIFPQLAPEEALLQLLKTWGQFSWEIVLQSTIDHFLQHGIPEQVQDEVQDINSSAKQKSKKETSSKWIPNSHFFNAKWIRKSHLRIKTNSNEEYHSLDGGIECGCCYNEFQFQMMVQCADGHLFCFQCLRKHVEESTFGGFQSCNSLPCMDTDGCKESIPLSEVQRTLPCDVLERYEQRQAQADIEKANLEDLVYCPFCNFPCQVEKDARVLECPNSKCLKDSCIKCKEPSHIPYRCEEVEKKSETTFRRIIEEVMAKAVIRVCNSCKAELVKVDGCNKVTCKCGITMCYACRKTISKNYSHFCEHVRVPGKPCQKCGKCGLWETELEDDVAMAAREKALEELAKKEPKLLRRSIGPPIGKQKKTIKRDPQFAPVKHKILSWVERVKSRVERGI